MMGQFTPSPEGVNFELLERARRPRLSFSILLTSIFSVAALYFAFRAKKALQLTQVDEKTNLLEKALRPALAKDIYEAVSIILEQNIPVRRQNLGWLIAVSLRSWRGRPLYNAILALLGDEIHRKGLWKENKTGKGPFYIHNDYFDEIFSPLKASILKRQETSRDSKNNQALMTALHYEEVMKLNLDIIKNSFFKRKGVRHSDARSFIEEICKIIDADWIIWDGFKQNITGHILDYQKKDSRFYEFANKLINVPSNLKSHVNESAKRSHLIDIISGKDDTAARFFREIDALRDPDLLPRGTKITDKVPTK